MARLTKTDAARQLGIARSTLYKLIDQGALSPTADGLIDSTELVRVAPIVDSLKHRPQAPAHTRQTSADIQEMDTLQRGERHHGHVADRADERPQTPGRERPETSGDVRLQTYADMIVDLLREQLRKAQEDAQREREAGQERERAYREHIAHLTVMLDQAHQQNQRLLEAPRPPPTPPVITPGPGVSAPPSASSEPLPSRSTVRQRILAVLREHPEGLTAVELRGLLRADRSLTDTCAGMFKNGLLRRVGRGRYVITPMQHDA
jgi:hypothetical protein